MTTLSAAQLLEILEHAPAAIYVKDAEGRFLFNNRTSAEILGAPAEEIRGRTDHAFMDGSFADRMQAHDRQVLASGAPAVTEESVPGPDGAPRIFVSLKFPLRGADGPAAAVCGISTDVTARKRAEEAVRRSESRLRATFDQAPVGIVEVDEAGRLAAANERFCEILGCPREELIGQSIRTLTAPEDRERSSDLLARMARGEHDRYAFEKQYLRGDGSRVWVRVTISALRDAAGRFRSIGTVEDVSARKAAETEREQALRALRAANERLRDSDRRKDDFLGMLSHELRNPLAPIRNALYLLDHADPGGPQARRAREIATRQVTHLTRLVDDLLDVTRIARGKIELRREDVDLVALIHRATDDHRALMQERSLTLALDVPPGPVTVHGDETRLAQVLGNLLHNAAKFTPAGGQVTVALREVGTTAALHVRDTGAGIEPALLDSVFEPFTQAEQTLARSEGGLGLGLALVKGLVALHGGDVSARSAGPGRGTEFVVTLPRADGPAAGQGEASRRAAVAARRRRVLVVDDNADAADTLAQLVELFGHEVAVARDGPSALAMARELAPDVVLCDIGLPGMSGYEVARSLRAGGATMRLVAVSGYAAPDDLARAAEAGFDAHVAKPADPERIEQLLRAAD